ncbi:conserved domain protein [Turicibacter sp. HGF1]|nr:conserved domain protein [Turicibacter sp. HGF1]
MTMTYLDNYERWPSEKTQYKLKKEEVTQMMLARLEKMYPGITSHIVVKELGTPKTMERYTKNPKGAVYGYAQTVKQSGRYRLKNQTNISNLFMSSAWNNPGGGYEGVISSGIMTARRIHLMNYK